MTKAMVFYKWSDLNLIQKNKAKHSNEVKFVVSGVIIV